MIFDYRPFITLDSEEAQLNDVSPGYADAGPNKWDLCGAAVYALILKWLGNGDPYEPQQIMDLIEGKNYHGGEVSAKLIDFFWAHRAQYPHLPSITVDQGGDIIQRARNAALLGPRFPTCNWWWSNSNGDIQPRNTGIPHWSAIIYDDGVNLGVFNIMRGQPVVLPYATARAAYVGEFTTFHAPLGDKVTQEEFNALMANNPWITGMAWRVKALIDNLPAVEDGPTKGEVNQLHAALEAVKTTGGSPVAGTISGTITGTITPQK